MDPLQTFDRTSGHLDPAPCTSDDPLQPGGSVADRWRWFAGADGSASAETEVCSAPCVHAGADQAVCPVSLVDFYL